jgi:uncharacterized membrane protein
MVFGLVVVMPLVVISTYAGYRDVRGSRPQ